MKKPDIKKLKYPLWFHIVFLVLTIVIPVVVVMVAGFQSDSTKFKVTFGVMAGLVIVWAFVNHFIIKDFIAKVRTRQVQLEHDYEIENGNLNKIKWIWFTNQLKYTAINAISIIIYGGLIAILLMAIKEQLITAVYTMLIMVISCYLIAYALKFITIITIRQKAEEANNEETRSSE